MLSVPFSGDEAAYRLGAKSLASAIAGRGMSFGEAAHEVVRFGFLMPGMSIALLPPYLAFDEPAVALVRIYSSLMTFAVWLWTLRDVRVNLGNWFAGALIILPALNTTWIFFTSAIWADVIGGLLSAIVFARVVVISKRMFSDRTIDLGSLIALEVIMIMMVYFRGNTFAFFLATHVYFVFLWLIANGLNGFPRTMGKLVLGVGTAAILLAPWSITASRELDSLVVTTTTIPLSMGVEFGDKGIDEFCFGPCPGRNIYRGSMNYALAQREKTGISVLDTFRLQSEAALEHLTFSHYMATVNQHYHNFLISFRERFVTQKFLRLNAGGPSGPVTLSIAIANRVITNTLYFPFLALFMLANVLVFRRSLDAQIASLCIKMFSLCTLVQPFIHVSHERYWIGFAPLLGLAGGFLGRELFLTIRPGSRAAIATTGGDMSGRPLLTLIQALYAFVFVAAAIVIYLAG